jgi:hypothetical protein
VYPAPSQAGPGNDINVGSPGSPEGANVEPCQPGCHPGKTLAEPVPDDPFGSAFAMAQAVARALWRRCFALSLAFRLLARIALLDLAVFFTWGSDLDGVGPALAGICIERHCLSAGTTFSACPLTFCLPLVGRMKPRGSVIFPK